MHIIQIISKRFHCSTSETAICFNHPQFLFVSRSYINTYYYYYFYLESQEITGVIDDKILLLLFIFWK